MSPAGCRSTGLYSDFANIMPESIQTFSTRHGELSIDSIADAKMAAVFRRGEYHQNDTVELLSTFLTPESVFVDGGAHIGSIAIPLARTAGRTIAYEADRKTCAILQHNATQNAVSVDVRQKGIGATITHGKIQTVREGNAGAHTLLEGEGDIDIVPLDEDLSGFDVLKLDVEGMELAVLQGADRIIAEKRPVILFEVNLSQLRAHTTSLHDLDSFFHKRGYRLFLPFRRRGMLVLGSIPSIPLIALLMYPGAYLLDRTSSVFDVLALPSAKSSPLPVVAMGRTVAHVVCENVLDKLRRLKRTVV